MRKIHLMLLAGALCLAFAAPQSLAKKKDPPKPAPEQTVKTEAKTDAKPADSTPAPKRGCCCCCWRAADCPLNKPTATPTAKPDEPAKTPAAVADKPVQTPGPGPGRGMGMGMGMGRGMPEAVRTFHQLLSDHEKIKRTVKDIPGGVSTTTTSDDPKVVEVLVIHVQQMKEKIESGQPIRRWDPLFDELFRKADKIVMKVEKLENGVKVTETSDDPNVARLIRQHAKRGVSEFVSDGWDRVHEPTPLPEGYPGAKK